MAEDVFIVKYRKGEENEFKMSHFSLKTTIGDGESRTGQFQMDHRAQGRKANLSCGWRWALNSCPVTGVLGCLSF